MPQQTCVYDITNAKDYQAIRKSAPLHVHLAYWDKCTHCHEAQAQLEADCQANSLGMGTPVVVTKCEIGKNKWCNDEWQRSRPQNIAPEDYGVPVLVAMTPEQNVTNAEVKLIGYGEEEKTQITGLMTHLGELVQKNAGAQRGSQAPPPAARQRVAAAPPPSNAAPRQVAQNNGGLYNPALQGAVASYVVEDTRPHVMRMKASQQYRQVPDPLCVPGVDCDHKTFQDRLIDFATSFY